MKIIFLLIWTGSIVCAQTLDDRKAERARLLKEGLGPKHPKILALDAIIRQLEQYPPDLVRDKHYMELREKFSALFKELNSREWPDDKEEIIILRKESARLVKRMRQRERELGVRHRK